MQGCQGVSMMSPDTLFMTVKQTPCATPCSNHELTCSMTVKQSGVLL